MRFFSPFHVNRGSLARRIVLQRHTGFPPCGVHRLGGPIFSKRFFTPIQVTSQVGSRFLKLSKSLLKGIGIAYLAGFCIIVKMYYSLVSRADAEQPIPKKWPFLAKWLARNGVNDETDKNYLRASRYLTDSLTILDEEYAKNPDRDEKWLAGYADLNIRLGLVKTRLGESDDAQKYLSKGYHINWGLRYLKAKAGVQLGILSHKIDHDEQQAEAYLRTAVADSAAAGSFPELENIALSTDGAIRVPKNMELEDDQIPPLLELAKLFARTGRLEDAFVTFLSTYRGIEDSKDPEKKPRGESICARALIRAHISEILWAFGHQKEAVAWGQEAYHLSKNFSHTTAECGACSKMSTSLVSKMYRSMGMMSDADKYDKLSAGQYVPRINLTRHETRWTMFAQ